MKKLNRKVFLSLFSIISLFLIFVLFAYNIENYKKEYNSVFRSLNFIDEVRHRPNPKNYDNTITRPESSEIDNMMIMDYEVYTVKLNNNTIYKIIGHNDITNDFDVENIALSLIEKDNQIKIGNLYNNKYAYNYKSNDTIVIINTANINSRLTTTLVISLIILLLGEVLILFVSRLMTKWITSPAIESFKKQKDFIADASHELKTPLAVIIASSDELKNDKKNSKYIENIKYESERMSKLITNLLDLSKLENGITINNYKDENLSKIVERICLTFEGIAFEEKISIESNIEENIIFKCSKEEIEKLISIILDNAIKHSYKNSSIVVHLYNEKNNINIDITNKGDPIEEGCEEKIFERFYRADKSRNRGTNRYGLGLAIAKNIVLNHKGIIKAYSKDGNTTFKIIFKK